MDSVLITDIICAKISIQDLPSQRSQRHVIIWSHPFKLTFPFNLGLPYHSDGKDDCWIITAFMIPHYHGTKAQEWLPKQALVESSGWEHQSTKFTFCWTKMTIPLNPAIHPSAFSWKKSTVAIFKGQSLRSEKSAQLVHCCPCFCHMLSRTFLVTWATAGLGGILPRNITIMLVSILTLRVG